jgi:hypothetical protein
MTLALPAGAHAATLEAGKACYLNGDDARLVGTGFAPQSPVRFAVNGRNLADHVTSDDAGKIVVTYSPPPAETERKLVIRATDSEDTSARTTIHVTQDDLVTADPSRSSNVRTWRAVFRMFGFGRGKGYIHYVNPSGKFKKTVTLGRLRGPCGRLKSTKRRVLPFDNPQFGRWTLQFDTRRRYIRRPHRNSKLIPVVVFRG